MAVHQRRLRLPTPVVASARLDIGAVGGSEIACLAASEPRQREQRQGYSDVRTGGHDSNQKGFANVAHMLPQLVSGTLPVPDTLSAPDAFALPKNR